MEAGGSRQADGQREEEEEIASGLSNSASPYHWIPSTLHPWLHPSSFPFLSPFVPLNVSFMLSSPLFPLAAAPAHYRSVLMLSHLDPLIQEFSLTVPAVPPVFHSTSYSLQPLVLSARLTNPMRRATKSLELLKDKDRERKYCTVGLSVEVYTAFFHLHVP